MDVPWGQQRAILRNTQHLTVMFSSGSGALRTVKLFYHLITTMMRMRCKNSIPTNYRGIFSKGVPSQSVVKGNMGNISAPHSWQVCAEVQILSLEIDGSARDRLAFDQSAATDISTYAGWIIKNTSDPLWRNKLLLLPHSHMQYVCSRGKVEVIFY